MKIDPGIHIVMNLVFFGKTGVTVAKNPVLHSKTKHIEVRYHFLRDNV
jgi:hypothetical protein